MKRKNNKFSLLKKTISGCFALICVVGFYTFFITYSIALASFAALFIGLTGISSLYTKRIKKCNIHKDNTDNTDLNVPSDIDYNKNDDNELCEDILFDLENELDENNNIQNLNIKSEKDKLLAMKNYIEELQISKDEVNDNYNYQKKLGVRK